MVGLAISLVFGVANSAATDTLLGGQTLTAGQTLVSTDGHYVLALQDDGDLVLSTLNGLGAGRVLWSSGTAGDTGDYAVLQDDGNLVLLDSGGQTLWSSNTSTAGCTNLVVQEDGNLVLYNAAHAVWSTHTVNTVLEPGDDLYPGQRIFSLNDQYEVYMQADGNLVLYGTTGALWSTHTWGIPGNHLEMQPSGDMVLYTSARRVLFETATDKPGSSAHLQEDGNFVVYGPGGHALWSSRTNATRAIGAARYTRPAFAACPPPPPPPAPAPTAPSDPVVLVPKNTTFPKLRLKHLQIKISWVWKRNTTRLHKVTIRRLPHNATINFSCKGKGCPRHRLRDRANWRQLNRLTRSLNGRYYRAGDDITIMITERHFRPEKISVRDPLGQAAQGAPALSGGIAAIGETVLTG